MTAPPPSISVVMPSYRSAKYIGDALDSVLPQLPAAAEIIIVDDSTDDTDEIVARYHDPRIKFTRNPAKVGVSNARNQALEQAGGELIAFHDADDISLPGRFAAQLEHLKQNPNIAMLGGGCAVLHLDGKVTKHKLPPKSPSRKKQISTNCFRTSSVIVRADALKQAGGFNPLLDFAEDWELWIRIGKQSQVANLQQEIFTYRATPDGITAREAGNHILWDTLVHSIALGAVGNGELQAIKQQGISAFEEVMPPSARAFYHRKCYRRAKKHGDWGDALTHCDALNKAQGFTPANWFRTWKTRRKLRAGQR